MNTRFTSTKSPQLRRRNRRTALMLFTALIVATVLCAIWIAFFGGLNKGQLKPYHSSVHTLVVRVPA